MIPLTLLCIEKFCRPLFVLLFQFENMTHQSCAAWCGRPTLWPTAVEPVPFPHACRCVLTVSRRATTRAMTTTCSAVRLEEHVTVATPMS